MKAFYEKSEEVSKRDAECSFWMLFTDWKDEVDYYKPERGRASDIDADELPIKWLQPCMYTYFRILGGYWCARVDGLGFPELETVDGQVGYTIRIYQEETQESHSERFEMSPEEIQKNFEKFFNNSEPPSSLPRPDCDKHNRIMVRAGANANALLLPRKVLVALFRKKAPNASIKGVTRLQMAKSIDDPAAVQKALDEEGYPTRTTRRSRSEADDDEDIRIATRTTTRSRSEADDEDDGDLEHNIKRQRMLNELGRQELQTINLQSELEDAFHDTRR